MVRTAFMVIYSLTLAIGLGAYSAWYVTGQFSGFGTLQIGQWHSNPNRGNVNADPYARARDARTGAIGLGQAEGLAFTASYDESGAPLSGRCDYVIEGRVPTNRLWTIRIVDEDMEPLPSGANRPTRTHSRAILHRTGGDFRIAISATIQPGNWLHFDHDGPAHLRLTLYDTTIAAGFSLTERIMPTVRLLGCQS